MEESLLGVGFWGVLTEHFKKSLVGVIGNRKDVGKLRTRSKRKPQPNKQYLK